MTYRGPEHHGNRFKRYIHNVAETSEDPELRIAAQKMLIDWLRAESLRIEYEQTHDPWDLPWPKDINGDDIWPQRGG